MPISVRMACTTDCRYCQAYYVYEIIQSPTGNGRKNPDTGNALEQPNYGSIART